MTTFQLTTMLIDETVVIEKATYPNGSTALVMKALDGEPIGYATAALDGALPGDGNVFIKDWSENTGVLAALQNAGLVGPVIRSVPHGFVEAHEVPLLSPLAEA